MPTRIRQRSPGWDESDDEYMPTWEPSPPRAKRQCTAARKCYAELDSEPEEVEDLSEGDYITEDEFDGGNDSQTNHPQNASMVDEDYDSDVIIVEVKSSPKKKLRGPSPVTTQDATSALVAHYGSGQNAGKIFKSLAVEVGCPFSWWLQSTTHHPCIISTLIHCSFYSLNLLYPAASCL